METTRAAFALFENAYDGAEWERFRRDLGEKQQIILLHDRDDRVLRGFSTVLVQRMPGTRPGRVVFSGDTVIDRAYWGQKQLQIEFTRLLLRLKLHAPREPLYWFLISKGYRTYMLLANAFPRAVPRHDRADDPELRSALDRLAWTRFGGSYDAATSIVRFESRHERVRAGLAPITARHMDNPHVRFFAARNPGHAAGDELACLAEVRLVDIARIAARIAAARLGRAFDRPKNRGAARWPSEVQHAEGS
jgi:hypothetical protein